MHKIKELEDPNFTLLVSDFVSLVSIHRGQTLFKSSYVRVTRSEKIKISLTVNSMT